MLSALLLRWPSVKAFLFCSAAVILACSAWLPLASEVPARRPAVLPDTQGGPAYYQDPHNYQDPHMVRRYGLPEPGVPLS